MEKKVKIISQSKVVDENNEQIIASKKKVAAYARVSTGSEEQATSFDNQVAEWTKRITSNPDWEFVKVYTDEGISGTSAKKRIGFQEMIQDAKNGKIDLILCKSISRLGRNTVLIIQTIRELKAIGVEIWFDNEHLSSLDPKSEFLFSVLSSMAQEESRHISENVTWTLRNKMVEGIPLVCTSRFLGYDKSEDGNQLVINESEAEIVKLIFDLYDSGLGCYKIANELQKRGYKTAAGKSYWHTSTVTGILRNEKYVGDLLQQKKITIDYLTHKRVKNTRGDLYSLENAHEAIISREQWNRVQAKLNSALEKTMGENFDKSSYNNRYPLSGTLICLKCGSSYKRRVWNSKHSTARRHVYQCTHYILRDEHGETCHSKQIGEQVAHEICCKIINEIYLSKSKVFSKMTSLIKSTLLDTKIEERKEKIQKIKDDLSLKIDKVIEERNSVTSNALKEKLNSQLKVLIEQYERTETQLANIAERISESSNSKERLNKVLSILGKNKVTPDMLTRDIVDVFFYKIFVKDFELVFVIDATHTKDLKELIADRENIFNYDPILTGEEKDNQSRFKTTIKYKVVLV